VVLLSGAALAVLVTVDLRLFGDLTLLFQLGFVGVCMAAVLTVRPKDFFTAGVLPPLLMLAVVLTLAFVARSSVADEVDSLVQAVVSGLAHNAGALTGGYALTLAILWVRQVATRKAMPGQSRAARTGDPARPAFHS
jgi:hypothetical protein